MKKNDYFCFLEEFLRRQRWQRCCECVYVYLGDYYMRDNLKEATYTIHKIYETKLTYKVNNLVEGMILERLQCTLYKKLYRKFIDT